MLTMQAGLTCQWIVNSTTMLRKSSKTTNTCGVVLGNEMKKLFSFLFLFTPMFLFTPFYGTVHLVKA